MLIEVQDLQIGDEILIPAGSEFRYIKVTRLAHPIFKKDKSGNKIPKIDYRGKPWMSSIKGAVSATETKWDTSYKDWSGNIVVRHHTKTEYVCSPENLSMQLNFDVSSKPIWLVRREE